MSKQKELINNGKGEIKKVREFGIKKKKNKGNQISPIAAAVPSENDQVFGYLLDRFLYSKAVYLFSLL